MKLLTSLIAICIGCLPYADFREYHYHRPQVPFNTGVPVHSRLIQQPQVKAQSIIQHYGTAGTAHISRQLSTSSLAQSPNGYLPPPVAPAQYQTSGTSQLSYNQAGAVGGVNSGQHSFAGTIAASYYPQQQYQHHHHHQQQQQQYTPNVNPLAQYQQQAAYGNIPQVQQPGQYAQSYGNGQQQYATSSYNSFGGGQAQFGLGTANQYGNGVGSTAGVGGQINSGSAGGINGNYISQSESGQLHSYPYQQKPIGNTEPFSRQVTTCFANGQCQRITLGPGQPDPTHQQVPAKVTPVSDKCRQIAQAKAAAAAAALGSYGGDSYAIPPNSGSGGNYAASIQDSNAHSHHHPNSIENSEPVRPSNRRLYPYTEIVLPKDPYN